MPMPCVHVCACLRDGWVGGCGESVDVGVRVRVRAVQRLHKMQAQENLFACVSTFSTTMCADDTRMH